MQTTDFSGVPKRKRGGDRITTGITVERRLWLHAKDHFNISLTVEAALRSALAAAKVDHTRAHDSEIWSPPDPLDPNGKPVTWGEARRLGYVDARDRPATGGAADEEPAMVGP